MVAIRIPGADSIDPVAPARDPGVQATPDEFGAGIGASAANFGNALTSLGAHLYEKRKVAEDQTFEQTYNVSAAPALQQAEITARKQFPDGGPGYMEALNTGAQQAHQGILDGLKQRGITPSDEALRKVNTSFAGRQANLLVSGVTYDNNAQVQKLKDITSDNSKAVASQVQAGTLSLDDGIKQIDEIVKSGKGVYGGAELRTFEEASQKIVVNGEIERLTRIGLKEQATALRDKWYGHVPIKGEGNAGAVAAAADELGISARNLAAVISYETGGKMDPKQWGGRGNNYLGLIQFGPEERAKYGVTPGMTFAEQMPAVVNYLRDRGLKPGMDVAQLYSIINAGSLTPNGQPRYGASDGNGTIADHVAKIHRDHLPAADTFLAGVAPKGEADGGLLPDPAMALHWQKQFDAQAVDQVRADAVNKIQIQKQSDATENGYLKDLFTDQPQTTVRQIVNDDKLTREAKERMIGVATRALKDDPLSQISQEITTQLLDRIRRPDGDPQKVTDLQPVYDAFIAGKLSRTDFQFLRKEQQDLQTPDGEKLGKKKSEFIKGVTSSITKSNPLMGKIDQSGDQQLYNLEWDIDKRIGEARKAGKNPFDLFDPAKPDFLGLPKSLEPYQKTLNQSLADRVKQLSAPAAPVAPDQTASPSKEVPLRKPGESPADYRKRIGAR